MSQNFATPYNAPVPVTYPAVFGGFTWGQPSVEDKLQEWLAEVTHMTTLSLIGSGITDPSQFPAVALAVAQSVCAEGAAPDCSQSTVLAAKYGAMAQQAYANVPASQWNPASFVDTSDTPDTPPPTPPPPAMSLFGTSTGDGDYSISGLALSELSAGTLKSGATAVNPADGKTYTLVAAQELMGWGGYWSEA